MAKMYHALISEATGEKDPEVLEKIEDIMRYVVFNSTLDWQTREEFAEGARKAKIILEELANA